MRELHSPSAFSFFQHGLPSLMTVSVASTWCRSVLYPPSRSVPSVACTRVGDSILLRGVHGRPIRSLASLNRPVSSLSGFAKKIEVRKRNFSAMHHGDPQDSDVRRPLLGSSQLHHEKHLSGKNTYANSESNDEIPLRMAPTNHLRCPKLTLSLSQLGLVQNRQLWPTLSSDHCA